MRTISLKLSSALHARLVRAAQERGQSKSDVVRGALEQFLNGQSAKPKPRTVSALELAGDLAGCAPGPADLSTNPKYLQGYGA